MEVCRRYSNRLDLVERLSNVLDRIDGSPVDLTLPHVMPTAVTPWRVGDRLREDQLHALLDSYRAGTTANTLAVQYQLSPSSVKRILRRHHVRRR